MNNNMLKSYLRDTNGDPYGTVVAVKNGEWIRYGYSLTNRRVDTFDKKQGTLIATKRALSGKNTLPELSYRLYEVIDAYKALDQRAIRYFKDCAFDNRFIKEGLLAFS